MTCFYGGVGEWSNCYHDNGTKFQDEAADDRLNFGSEFLVTLCGEQSILMNARESGPSPTQLTRLYQAQTETPCVNCATKIS